MKFSDYIDKKLKENFRQDFLVVRQCFTNNEKDVFKTMEFISNEFNENTAGRLNKIIEDYLEGK